MENKKTVIIGILILIGILIFLLVGVKPAVTSVNQMNDAQKKLWEKEVSAVQKKLHYNATYSKAGMGDHEFRNLDYACENADSVIKKLVPSSKSNFSCKKSSDGKSYYFKIMGTGDFDGLTNTITCTEKGC